MDEWTDGQVEGWTDTVKWTETNGRLDSQVDRLVNGWMAWTDIRTNGQMGIRVDGQSNRQTN